MNNSLRARFERAVHVLVTVTVLSSPVLLVLSPPVFADLYKWEDSRGVLHITDDLGKVPEAKRHHMKVFKIKPHKRKGIGEAPVYIPPTKPVKEKVTLYGGHTLEWWKAAFSKLIDERDALKDDIEKKRQFITVFEGGRRFGQMFGETEVANYKKYKEEIVKDRERLVKVEEKLDKLRREARIEDVPPEVMAE